jgi:hypothetical protein
MSTYIQNYGFTKTYIKDNNKKLKNEIKWIGDYDGNKANIDLDINDNGNRELVSMHLDNNDLMNILGIQPVQIPLEQRLTNDFFVEPYRPITLEGALTKRKTHKHSRHNKYLTRRQKHLSRRHKHKYHHKKRKTHKL